MKVPVRTLEASPLGGLDRIVCARIENRTERRRHAGLLMILISAGLGSALVIPAAGLMGGGIVPVAVAAAISSLCLLLAALLAATGAFDAVAGAAVACLSLILALAATWSAGTGSPLLWLLAVAPLECCLAHRKSLARMAIGAASLAAGFVIGAEQLSVGRADCPPFVAALGLGFAVLYALSHAYRLHRRLDARRETAKVEETERRLVDHMLGEAVLRFAPDGTLIQASDGSDLLFGEALEDGRHPFLMSAVHVADRVRYLSAFGDIRGGAASARCEVRLSAPGTTAFCDVAMDLTAIRDARRHLVSVMLVVTRPQPKAGEGDDRLRRELDEARSLSDAKSGFLAVVSHELRTPLNAIIGFSDLLEQEFFGAFETPRQKEYVGLIRQSGEHLLAVVNGLLDVSKIEAGRYELVPESFEPGELFASALAAVRGEADRKGLRLTLRDEYAPAMLHADRRAVYQILLNLLSNAVKFTEEGEVVLSARGEGAEIELAVADTGAGIDPAELPKLGQPFVQGSSGLARRYAGTGLGLSLVKGLAELHGGRMTIRSQPGRGTTVLVTLPREGAAEREDFMDNRERVVALKHARTNDTIQSPLETRRSA